MSEHILYQGKRYHPESPRVYGVLGHDFQVFGKWRNHPKDISDPETVQTTQKESMCELDDDWEWFLFEQYIYCAFGHTDRAQLSAEQEKSLINAYASMMNGTRAFNNRWGIRTKYSVVTGDNVGAERIRHDALSCGGNLHKFVMDGDKIKMRWIGGELCAFVEYIQGNKPNRKRGEKYHAPPSGITMATHPWLILKATIGHLDNSCTPFPQIRKYYNGHTPFLFIAREPVAIPVHRFLRESEKQPRMFTLEEALNINPYIPSQHMNYP